LARFSVSAVEGPVVSKPIAKKTTSRSGFAWRSQRVERRVDHPHVGALRLGLEQRAVEPGTRIMSPKQVKITPARARSRSRRRRGPSGSRTPGSRAVDELDVRRQQVVDPYL
jgi:hypothetical protein